MKKSSIKSKLLALAVIPAIVPMLIMLIIAWNSLRSGMYSEGMSGLSMLAEAVKSGYALYPGDYSQDSNGNLMKGEENITSNMEALDEFVKGSKADVTICYGKTRAATTLVDEKSGERIVGTDVDDEVWKEVQEGKTYTTQNITINKHKYIAVYVPLEDSTGKIIGMVFAGQPRTDMDSFINGKVITILIIGFIIIVVAVLAAAFVSGRIVKGIEKIAGTIKKLSDGHLDIHVETKIMNRKDELGQMARSMEELAERLKNIVHQLQNSSNTLLKSGEELHSMAAQSSMAADEISHAVEDISKGAVSQAEEIESASQEIVHIGNIIENIVGNVGNLTETSTTMSNASNVSVQTMGELSESNDRTTDAIKHIAEQINQTNEAICQIRDSASLITEIADETSLLSLNASIESARAGEAGKGFAVVASEIQKLSVQSSDAAAEIQKVINILENQSLKTIDVMKEAEQLMEEQQEKFTNTKERFHEVSDGIHVSTEETSVIRTNTDACNSARTQVIDSINNLSAISQENAASAQETTASMQELNATINLLTDSAEKLKDIAGKLNEEMGFFKL